MFSKHILSSDFNTKLKYIKINLLVSLFSTAGNEAKIPIE